MRSMDREYEPMQVEQMGNGARHVLTGIVVGGLIGATAMLFLAPVVARCADAVSSKDQAQADKARSTVLAAGDLGLVLEQSPGRDEHVLDRRVIDDEIE